MKHSFFKLCAIATFALTLMPDFAQANTVAATVNGQIITTYEVAQRKRLIEMSGSKASSALNELIDERLKLGAARKMGINIKEDEVNSAFSNVARNTRLSEAQLEDAMNSRGVSPRAFKDRIRAELAWRQLVQIRYARSAPVPISSNETLSNFVLITPDSQTSYSEFRLARVVVVSDVSGAAAARSKANSIRGSISSCEGLKEKFKNHPDVVVLDPTTKTSKELPDQIVELLKKTPIGKATPAYEGNNGIEIGVVCNKKILGGGSSTVSKNKNGEDDLQKKLQETSVAYLKELREQAVIEISK